MLSTTRPFVVVDLEIIEPGACTRTLQQTLATNYAVRARLWGLGFGFCRQWSYCIDVGHL